MSKNKILKEWIDTALIEYKAAKHLLEGSEFFLDIAAYHCQRSIEKSLKAFLFANDIQPPKTHDLGFICSMCIEMKKEFKHYLQDCEKIAVYAIKPRYPSKFGVVKQDVDFALKKALEIHQCVAKLARIDE